MKKSEERRPAGFKLKDTRDQLAADRTILANERTLLSYIRLSLTLFVAGVSFIKFFENPFLAVLGWMFIPLAALALLAGVRRHRRCGAFLRELKEREDEIVSGAARSSQTERGRSGPAPD